MQTGTCENFLTKDILVCPHCGNVIKKSDLYCYFRWDGGWCSDMRHLAPQEAVPSLIQYCTNCGKYHWVENSHVLIKDTDDYNWIEPVVYPALKDGAKLYEGLDWNDTVEFNQRFRLLWAYNDYFFRNQNKKIVPLEEDKAIHKANIHCLVRFYQEKPQIAAELLRQAGDFDDSIRLAESIINSEYIEQEEKFLVQRIIELAIKKECRPFELVMQ